jgi:Flp pilus assembly protein TadG
MRRRAEPGQSTVEMAFLLPLVAIMVAVVLHVGVIVRDHLAFWRTTGTAARIASIAPHDTSAVQTFVDNGLHLSPTTAHVEHVGDLVTTTLRHRYSFRLLFVNTHLRIFDMTASVTMHVEDTG